MIATSVVAFLIVRGPVSNAYLNLSIFLAFATVYPEFEILLFFFIPVKVKWLGWITGGFVILMIAVAALPAKLAAIVSLGNYLLFFGPDFWRLANWKLQSARRRREFESKSRSESEVWHRCVVCGRTERDDPNLEFRTTDDDREYCLEHLAHALPKSAGPNP
jgi:hypothetical protein